MVGVVRIGLIRRDDRARSDEARDVVDVAVRVVAGNAALQPDDLLDAKIIGKNFFHVLARESRVALLHIAEQAFFGGDQCAASIDVDAAALQNDAMHLAVDA